ncbi:MAG: hypothetical protein K2H86_06525 [Muribaculaceae bacterium]|nr:hypothetical protein [Muribaculaceae bacterium]
MKKLLGIILCCTIFIPLHAQYLLEESETQNYNSQYLLEQPKERKEKTRNHSTENDNLFSKSLDIDGGYEISKGYRGFADFCLGFGNNCISISSTHGYQLIDDYLFIGGGLSYWNFYGYGRSALPIFLDLHSDFLRFNKWSVYADIKAGYSVCCMTGLYSDDQFGVRYGLTDKLGINLGIGYGLQIKSNSYYEDKLGFVTIKIGVDF